MTTEDILAMLRDGDSIEDIGNHFAKLMNAAKAQYDQEQKAQEARKLSSLTDIIARFIDWIDEYVTSVPEDEDPEVLAKELIKTLDATKSITSKLFDSVDSIDFDTLDKLFDQKKGVNAAKPQFDSDLQDIVDMFLGK
jgi:arginyl-tRNA synthetase